MPLEWELTVPTTVESGRNGIRRVNGTRPMILQIRSRMVKL